MTERLGIVYTPIEVVDFIIHSVEHVLNTEFNSSMAEKNVHILDPFTGTGTFITRLLQSGIIPADKLPHKYQHEIHANEIVLLAYYIAAINIEATYHGILNGNITGREADDSDRIFEAEYQPFEGICLTDTFQMNEKADLVDELLEENSARRKRQQQLDIRVIIGNPPYSAGQESANDNNANVAYPKLDERISNTYAEQSSATSTKNLMDSYIRAIRWASDRLGDQGVLAYVSGSAWLERSFADGMRRCLEEEFTSIYIINLRGDIRKNMLSKGRAKEGQNIFGSGSMTGIAITVFIKNPAKPEKGKIYYLDIGDDLKQNEKLDKIGGFQSLAGVKQDKWERLSSDQYGDWVNQRDPNFDTYIELGNKKNKEALTVFRNYSLGIGSNRDVWVYNSSALTLSKNMNETITFFNNEAKRLSALSMSNQKTVTYNAEKISWSSSLIPKALKGFTHSFDQQKIVNALYRPFQKQKLYNDNVFIHRIGQMPSIFPDINCSNIVIFISGVGARSGFSTLVSNLPPSLDTIEKSQCFPLYLYEKAEPDTGLFAQEGVEAGYQRRDAITDEAMDHFQEAYPELSLSKEDIFYYIYGLLHSEEYREKYADNLSKQLPRIPRVKAAKDFTAFAAAGRKLAQWHLNYETSVLNTTAKLTGKTKGLAITANGVTGGKDEDFYVTKMKFGKKKDPETGKNVDDKTRVAYNSGITIENIPEEAYDYVVNGKPALEWVMERQSVTTHKASGITNDANDWAIETMGNAKYPLELFLRVITVSLETQAIVNSLPKLEIKE